MPRSSELISAGAVHSRGAGSSFSGAIFAPENYFPHGMVKIAEMPFPQHFRNSSPHSI